MDATAPEKEQGFSNSDFEFIELKNVGDTTLDLKNVRFTKGINYDFVNGSVQSLASGEMLVLARNLNAFTIRYGNTNSLAGEYTPNNLSNGGENIKLSFGAGVAIREFVYQDNEPWPEAADGKGYSLVLKEPQKLPDHNDPKNWTISSALGGSPGKNEIQITYDLWKSSTFSLEQLQDPLVSNQSSDPDQDGYSNLLEYAFGGNALVKDDQLSPAAKIITKGAEEYLALEYRKRIGANDYAFVIEGSKDLNSWSSVNEIVLERMTDNGDGTTTYMYRILSLNEFGDQGYLRLKVMGK